MLRGGDGHWSASKSWLLVSVLRSTKVMMMGFDEQAPWNLGCTRGGSWSRSRISRRAADEVKHRVRVVGVLLKRRQSSLIVPSSSCFAVQMTVLSELKDRDGGLNSERARACGSRAGQTPCIHSISSSLHFSCHINIRFTALVAPLSTLVCLSSLQTHLRKHIHSHFHTPNNTPQHEMRNNPKPWCIFRSHNSKNNVQLSPPCYLDVHL